MKAPPEAPSYRRVAALRELARRTLVQRRADELLMDQHTKQAAFVADPRPRIAAHCGRRAGKSHAIAKRLARTALVNPDGVSVFVAISAARAIEILGRGMTLFSRRHLLNAQQVQMHGQTYWRFPNGHRVWCAGCKNRADAEKFRGDPYCAAVVDEADSMRHHLEYLVEDCLDPALLDRRGWLALTGTPGATPQGYFYEITTGDGRPQWPTYHWTALDNPYLPHARDWLKERRLELGLQEDSPTYRREWQGEWVRDLDSLCYPYDPARNRRDGPLEYSEHWRFTLGIDLGASPDPTAFVALAHKPGIPGVRIAEAEQFHRLIPSAAAARVEQWRQHDRYPKATVVPDTGGLGKAYAIEWADRYGIQYEPANKTDVAGQIAIVGGMLRTGELLLHVPGARELIDEWTVLPWNAQRTGPDPSYAHHLSDAARYGLLHLRQYYRAQRDPPARGSPEWIRQQEEAEFEEMLRRNREKTEPTKRW